MHPLTYLASDQEFIPTKQLSTRVHIPWLIVTLKRLISKKAKLYQRPEDWQQFKGFQHQVCSLMHEQHNISSIYLISLPSLTKLLTNLCGTI